MQSITAPRGWRRIARRVRLNAGLAEALAGLGYGVNRGGVRYAARGGRAFLAGYESDRARRGGASTRRYADGAIGVSLDETVSAADLQTLFRIFGQERLVDLSEAAAAATSYPATLARTSQFLTHPVFNSFHTETEMMRYIFRLQQKDLSLAHSMIALGSCTMSSTQPARCCRSLGRSSPGCIR